MARHSSISSILKLVVALLTALLVTVIGGLAVPAMAHDGSGSNSGSSTSGPDDGSNSGPGPNSGPGNADCHDNSGPGPNSGPGSTSGSGSGSNSGSNSGPGPNSGPGNADDNCVVDPGTPGGDSGGVSSSDPGTRQSASNSGGSSSVAVQSQPSTATTQAGVEVPAAVNAGLSGSDGEQSPPALAVLSILFGLAMTSAAVVRRRARV